MELPVDKLISKLKNPNILKRKPNLKLCSNHFKDEGPTTKRAWTRGTAKRDGRGWYVKAS